MKTNIKYILAFLTLPNIAFANFTDVDSSHVYADAIAYVQSEGIVSGYKDGTYGPEKSINRAELTKIVVEANFEPETIESCLTTRFSDVNTETDWFTSYVCVATASDIVGGYPDGTFRPGRNVNLAEASKIILKSFGHSISTGEDIWFRPFVEGLAEHNAIPTSIEDYDSFLTRGEMAEIIYRLKEEIINKSSQDYSSNGLIVKEQASPFEPSVTNNEADEVEEPNTTNESESDDTPEADESNTEMTQSPETDETTPEETVETTTETTEQSETTETETASEEEVEVTVSTGTNVSYQNYSQTAFDNAVNNSYPVALFFHADWCPQCQQADSDITQRLTELPDNSLVLKVDFDTETELRSKYKVTQQHTAVLFNSQGQKAKSIGFSFDDLKVGLQ